MLALSALVLKLRDVLARVEKPSEPGSFAAVQIQVDHGNGLTRSVVGVLSDIAVTAELPGTVLLKLNLTSTSDNVAPIEPDTPAETWPTLQQIERDYMVRVLQHTHGNKQAAARILGIDRTTVNRKINLHKVDPSQLSALVTQSE
jgi:DNA-binding NtrC family response regulator